MSKMGKRGSFEGVKTHPDTKTPRFITTGAYNTVRYGWLSKFILAIPVGSTIQKFNHGNIHYYLVSHKGKQYGFIVVRGDVTTPSWGEEDLKEVLTAFRRAKLIKEAKAVFR